MLDPETARSRQITGAGAVTDLCWSPDGRHIAYCAEQPGADGAANYILRMRSARRALAEVS